MASEIIILLIHFNPTRLGTYLSLLTQTFFTYRESREAPGTRLALKRTEH